MSMRKQLMVLALAGLLASGAQAQAPVRPSQTNFAHAVVNIDRDPGEQGLWWQENGWLIAGLGAAGLLGFLLAVSGGGNSPT